MTYHLPAYQPKLFFCCASGSRGHSTILCHRASTYKYSVSRSCSYRFMSALSLSMTRQRMTSFHVRRRAFASGWVTSFRSSLKTTTTGGRESWRTPRTAPRASSLHLSCRSGEFLLRNFFPLNDRKHQFHL